MIRQTFGLALAVSLFASSSAFAQSNDTVAFVQQTLADLGYDPGPVDGAWGGNTRTALNAYRATAGLPEARDLTGSSLDLIHRQAPGAQSLPEPGLILPGLYARAEVLGDNLQMRLTQCNNALGTGNLWGMEPVQRFTGSAAPEGYIGDDEDWYSAIAAAFVVDTADCMTGRTMQCERVWNTALQWAEMDALQTPVGRSANSEAFDDVAWMANSVLAPLIASAAIVETQLEVDPVERATILDWAYDRANHFNHIVRSRSGAQAPNNTIARNHSVAAVLPSVLLGAWIGDRELFDRGRVTFEFAMGNLRDDGSMPTETQRGSRALHYTGYVLSMFGTIATAYEAQGEDLWSYTNDRGVDVHDAVSFALDGWQDWEGVVYPYARANHAAPRTPDRPMVTYFDGNMGWIPAYRAAFPDHPNIERLRTLNLDPVICSPDHVASGHAGSWWCTQAGTAPLTMRQMLLEHSVAPSIYAHGAGYNASCLLSPYESLLDD